MREGERHLSARVIVRQAGGLCKHHVVVSVIALDGSHIVCLTRIDAVEVVERVVGIPYHSGIRGPCRAVKLEVRLHGARGECGKVGGACRYSDDLQLVVSFKLSLFAIVCHTSGVGGDDRSYLYPMLLGSDVFV